MPLADDIYSPPLIRPLYLSWHHPTVDYTQFYNLMLTWYLNQCVARFTFIAINYIDYCMR